MSHTGPLNYTQNRMFEAEGILALVQLQWNFMMWHKFIVLFGALQLEHWHCLAYWWTVTRAFQWIEQFAYLPNKTGQKLNISVIKQGSLSLSIKIKCINDVVFERFFLNMMNMYEKCSFKSFLLGHHITHINGCCSLMLVKLNILRICNLPTYCWRRASQRVFYKKMNYCKMRQCFFHVSSCVD